MLGAFSELIKSSLCFLLVQQHFVNTFCVDDVVKCEGSVGQKILNKDLNFTSVFTKTSI